MGKNGYELTLFASTQTGRQKWLEYIDAAQQKLRARVDFLNTTIISQAFFTGINKVNCVAPYGKLILVLRIQSSANLASRRWSQVDLRH